MWWKWGLEQSVAKEQARAARARAEADLARAERDWSQVIELRDALERERQNNHFSDRIRREIFATR